MKFTIKREALLETLLKVKAVVPGRATIPILTNILMRMEKGRLSLVATDLEQALVGEVKAISSGNGAIAVNPKSLEQFLKAVDAPTLSCNMRVKVERGTRKVSHFNTDKNALEEVEEPWEKRQLDLIINAGSASTILPGQDWKDYPPIPKLPDLPLKFANLGKAIGEVRYAVSRDSCRPVLQGMSLKQKGNKTELAAADGFRLAITSVRMKGKLGDPAILTAGGADLVSRLFSGTIAAGRFGGTNISGMAFRQNGLVLFSTLIQSTFPEYEKLVPSKGKVAQVKTAALEKALKVAASTGKENTPICLDTKGNNLMVSRKSGDGQETSVKIPSRGKLHIALDINYLRELLQHCGAEFVIRTTDDKSPAVVRNNGTIHVVMPRVRS